LLVYLTQDALLDGPDALRTLLRAFEDPSVAAAFGRNSRVPAPALWNRIPDLQLPVCFQPPITPKHSRTRLQNDFHLQFFFGLSAFRPYRGRRLPTDVIFGEDTVTAARLILCGYKIAYVAEASVFHSHSYTARDQFKRFFDVESFTAVNRGC